MKIDYGSAELMDPLVINLSGQNADVSDETFTFDIDSDGKEDNISLLAKNCGFLALDLNGDGKINNGSELLEPHQEMDLKTWPYTTWMEMAGLMKMTRSSTI